MNPSCSVILLNWNGRALLEEYLPSVLAHTPSDKATVIVADNGSTDDSIAFLKENYPQVECLELDKNWGFAEGYNKAIGQCNSDIVVLLNTDVRVSEAWLDEPLSLLKNNTQIAAVQPKLLSDRETTHFEYAGAAGGLLDKYGYPFCRGRVFATVEKDEGQYNEVAPVFWASGAALFIKRACYLEVGGLDDEFFAHQEEIDLCWRLHLRSYQVYYSPNSVVYHLGGATLDSSSPRKTYLNYRNNLLMLFKNLPATELKSKLRIRLCLDLIAALVDTLKGRFQHSKAVIVAWRDFRRMRKGSMTMKRMACQDSKSNEPYPKLFAPYSVVWQYFAKGRKRFSDMP